MSNLKFALIGDGAIAKYHRKAIEHVGGELACVYDPVKYSGVHSIDGIPITDSLLDIENYLSTSNNFFVICSPSHMHRQQIRFILEHYPAPDKIICEKPAFLPWEIPIDNDSINICLQLRYIPDLPKDAALVKMVYVRNEDYFSSWKGDPQKTGGLFYNLFIHGIDLAQRLGADFIGRVQSEGFQDRFIGLKWSWPEDVWGDYDRFVAKEDKIDILNINIQSCYNAMYEDIISGGGIKPRDTFYLDWILKRNSEIFGYGKGCIGETIKIGHELL